MSGLHSKKTVVPLDFSDFSYAALKQATEIADADGEVLAVHVLPVLPVMEPGNLYGTVTDETRVKAVKQTLDKKIAELNCNNVTPHALIGDAGHEIAAFAQREGADLIVMPSHGRGFFKHLLLGSVAERVIRLAHCPVLVLRS